MEQQPLPQIYALLAERFQAWLAARGVGPDSMDRTGLLLGLLLTFLVFGLLSMLLNWLLTGLLRRLSRRTTNRFDDHLVKNRTPRLVARIIPLMLAYNLIPAIFADIPAWAPLAERLFNIFFVVLAVRILCSVVHSVRDAGKENERYRSKPLDSYAQVMVLLLWIIGGILVFSQLTGHSAWTFLTAMGSASAVLLLVFKDTILGFVASIQISANDLVRLGDWITMPKYGADGDVAGINLTTVMVRNFDNTITTIPTYALISDSFQNWRGMQESGARRLKRPIRLKLGSIRHLTDQEVDQLRRIALLAPYIDERRMEILDHNARHAVDRSMPVNGRNFTNIGLFRVYMERYAFSRPGIRPDMGRMVRQLPPDQFGLPLELYCFTDRIRSEEYEGLISDIFDHLLASARFFHLELHEAPASDDVRALGRAWNRA